MTDPNWHFVGKIEDLKLRPLQQIEVSDKKIALSYKDNTWGAISGFCNHVGGPLGKGCLEGDYIVCPWHYWKFHRQTGTGQPGYEENRVQQYETKIENEELWINLEAKSKRARAPHEPHPLSREVQREPGKIRIAGISTTAMDRKYPRYSTSDALLESAIDHVNQAGHETKLIKLNDLNFRNCEGFYSKAARACTWPCSITQMDPSDQLDQVYEAMVHWADVIIVSTPIRWGKASSLYYKMVERMNCIQNQITINDHVLIQNKVAGFIITGGQDNIQSVAGDMLGFFSELGFVLPPFPYIAHSLGWTSENMERNMEYVQESTDLREGAKALADRCIKTAESLLKDENLCPPKINRAGRKAHNSFVKKA
jgi:multimeric flavodoxin WrbA/nitrite reductase/ring-hydroxylating ferredoxin subunit